MSGERCSPRRQPARRALAEQRRLRRGRDLSARAPRRGPAPPAAAGLDREALPGGRQVSILERTRGATGLSDGDAGYTRAAAHRRSPLGSPATLTPRVLLSSVRQNQLIGEGCASTVRVYAQHSRGSTAHCSFARNWYPWMARRRNAFRKFRGGDTETT